MNREISDCLLKDLSGFVSAEIGLDFPPERWPDLERGLRSASAGLNFADVGSCGRWLISSAPTSQARDILARALTIGETYFFREPKTIAALEGQILPDITRRRRGGEQRLRLWSAGCCTGEEAYTLAIAVSRAIPDWVNWRVSILATDINAEFLAKAQAGIYKKWSFRETSAPGQSRYFRETGEGGFEVDPELKKKVAFRCLNLARDGYPSAETNTGEMDVIFCRNVLMYFSPDQQRAVVQRLYGSLSEGGWLCVSSTEGSSVLFSNFEAIHFSNGAILYRKGLAKKLPPVERPVAWPSVLSCLESERSATAVASKASAGEQNPALSGIDAPAAGQGNGDAGALRLADRSEGKSAKVSRLGSLARSYADQRRLTEARACVEEAVASDKLDPALCYLWAMILEESGDFTAATEPLRRALYLDPDFVLAHFAMANLALRRQRAAEARRHFENALRLVRRMPADQILPESDGITAGRLTSIIESVRCGGEL